LIIQAPTEQAESIYNYGIVKSVSSCSAPFLEVLLV